MKLVERVEKLREEGRKYYKSLEWQPVGDSPTTKYYTDWSLYDKHVSSSATSPRGLRGNGCKPLRGEDIVVYAGNVIHARLPSGVQLQSGPDEEEYVDLIGSLVKPSEAKHLALHYSFLEAVNILVFREETRSSLHVALCTPYSPQPVWLSNHLVLVVEKGASASLVLEDYSMGGLSGFSTVIEAFLEEGSTLELFTSSRGAANAPTLHVQRTSISQGARMNSSAVLVAGLMHRVEGVAWLKGPESRLNHYGVMIGRSSSRGDYIYNVVHQAPRSFSRPSIYGIALDESTIVVRGNSRVMESGAWSNTVLEATVLILGDKARGYSAPMMEIDTGDVETAVHHAANYRIRKDQLFYLQSRGLGRDDASTLILHGYAWKAVEMLDDETVKNVAASIVDALISSPLGKD